MENIFQNPSPLNLPTYEIQEASHINIFKCRDQREAKRRAFIAHPNCTGNWA